MAWSDYVPHTWEGAAASPFTGLFALGAGVNELTGGNSTTWSPVAAVQGGSSDTTYSRTTQALSGYQGSSPYSGGDWQLPLLNRAGGDIAGDAIGGGAFDFLTGFLSNPKALVILAAAAGVAFLALKK